MLMIKGSVYFMMILVCLPLIFANTNFVSWGNSGYQFGRELTAPQTLWASNLKANIFSGSSEPVMVNNTIYNTHLPMILNPLKSLNAQANEVYLFDAAGINVFDSNFAGVCTYALAGWNGTFAVFDTEGFSTYLFAYKYKTGTDDLIKILNRSSSCFSVVKTINITDSQNYTGNLRGGKNGKIYADYGDGNLSVIDVWTGVQADYAFWKYNASAINKPTEPYFDSDMEVDDYNGDGYDEILMIRSLPRVSNPDLYVGVFDTNTNAWTTQFTVPLVGGITDGYSIGSAVIGSTTRYIIIYNGIHTGSNLVHVYDFAGNLKIELTGSEYNIPSVADINKDGKNELIMISSTLTNRALIYSDSFTLKYSVADFYCLLTPRGACGFTDFGSYWLGMAASGGFEYMNVSMNDTVLNAFYLNTLPFYANISNTRWSGTDIFGVLPVAVKSSAASDFLILGVEGRTTSVVFSSVEAAFCGNDECEAGETIVACPEDCSPPDVTSAVLTYVNINPCYLNVWLQNTTVQVTMKAETMSKSNVDIHTYIDYATCGRNDSFTNLPTGTMATLNFIANCTGSGILTVTAKAVDDFNYNTLTFPFEVSAYNGISFGEGECGIKQPLDIAFAGQIANITTDYNDNILTNAMRQISGLTNLGLNVLTILIIIILSVIIFIIGTLNHMPVNLIFGSLIIMDVGLFILGGLLGWISIGIVIALCIFALIALGVWFSRAMHPTG